MVFKKSRGGGSSRAALQCLGKEMETEWRYASPFSP